MVLDFVRSRQAGLQSTWDRNDRVQARQHQRTPGSTLLPWLRVTQRGEGHEGCVNVLRWSPTGTHLYSGSDDRCLGVWRHQSDVAQPLRLCARQRTSHSDNLFDIALDPREGGRQMAIGSRDGVISLHDVVVGATVRSFDTTGEETFPGGATVYRVLYAESHSGYLAATRTALVFIDPRGSDAVCLYSESQGRIGRGHGLTSVAQVPDEPYDFLVACNAGSEAQLRLFDLRRVVPECNSWRRLHRDPSRFPGESGDTISGIAFRPDGRELAVATHSTVELFEFPPQGEQLKRSSACGWADGFRNERTYLKHPVYFGTQGSTFVGCGSDNGSVFIWSSLPQPLSGVPLLRTENVISHVDGQVVNVVCPHPTYDACPVIACSGIDHDIKVLAPLARSPYPLHCAEEDRDVAFPTERRTPSNLVRSLLLASHLEIVAPLEAAKGVAADAVRSGRNYTCLVETSHALQCLKRSTFLHQYGTSPDEPQTTSAERGRMFTALVGMGLNGALASGRLNDHALAFALADLAATLEPENPKVWFRRSSASLALKRFEEAEEGATKAQALLGGPGKDAAVDDLLARTQTALKAHKERMKAAFKGMFA